ncbi:cupin domain-containing protein [SAR202 cluster bacterium AC-647-N09_OGT_505m]|nr:cupin domain-containing protein [SAR202 cluster bacterium AC-647-N09_OGT_505m]
MGDVVLIKPDQRGVNTSQTPGMVRQAGIAPEVCASRGLWIGFVSTPPGPSGAHHHGDAESGIYILRGRVRMHFGNMLQRSLIAEAGDFLYVPPHTVHVEENLSTTETAELIVARNSADFMVVNVSDPRDFK